MLKISRKASVTLSIVCAAAFILCVLAGFFMIPKLSALMGYANEDVVLWKLLPEKDHAAILADAYVILTAGLAAILLLLKLLLNIRRSIVFTEGNVALIRAISWLCFLEGFAFLVLSLWFILSLIVSVSAFFLGLVVRVVKNVMEEATAIKNENDLTV